MRTEIILGMVILAAVVGSLAFITVNRVPASTTTSTTLSTSSTATTTSSSTSSDTSTTSSTSTSSSSTGGQGIVNGTISIGPLQPTCAINSTKGPPPSNIASIEAIVTSPAGFSTHVPLDWSVYAKCEAVGRFQIPLQSGSYSLDLSSCNFMGCANSLPKPFLVSPDKMTVVNVSIDTGIR